MARPNALAFTPTAATVHLFEQGAYPETAARGDRFDLFDLANDLELHLSDCSPRHLRMASLANAMRLSRGAS
jgi:hypothetical protein